MLYLLKEKTYFTLIIKNNAVSLSANSTCLLQLVTWRLNLYIYKHMSMCAHSNECISACASVHADEIKCQIMLPVK